MRLLTVSDLKSAGVITVVLNDNFSAWGIHAGLCVQQYLSYVLLVTYFIVLYINVNYLIQLHKLETNKDIFFFFGGGGHLLVFNKFNID